MLVAKHVADWTLRQNAWFSLCKRAVDSPIKRVLHHRHAPHWNSSTKPITHHKHRRMNHRDRNRSNIALQRNGTQINQITINAIQPNMAPLGIGQQSIWIILIVIIPLLEWLPFASLSELFNNSKLIKINWIHFNTFRSMRVIYAFALNRIVLPLSFNRFDRLGCVWLVFRISLLCMRFTQMVLAIRPRQMHFENSKLDFCLDGFPNAFQFATCRCEEAITSGLHLVAAVHPTRFTRYRNRIPWTIGRNPIRQIEGLSVAGATISRD